MQKAIKLTENQLRTIVKEAVHNIISDLGDKDIDIKAITKTIFPDHEPPKKFMPKNPIKESVENIQLDYPNIKELPDGEYFGYRYSSTFELEDGKKYYTSHCIKCTKKWCGGLRKYRVKGDNIECIN